MSCGPDERHGEKYFSNEDIYIGCFNGLLPHGQGKYTWPDGAAYEGEWKDGKMAGKGSIFWPSKSQYEGEFCGISLHGLGTLSTMDGIVYNGYWWMNTPHGLGTKSYANSDVYMGFWREGKKEGIGKYTWSNGSIYVGNWKDGRMNGRGVLKWANGDLFNGHWLDGLEHGTGYYYFSDGSCFYGTWSKGLKDGWGVYYPSGSRLPFHRKYFESNLCTALTKCLFPFTLLKSPDDQNESTSTSRDSSRCKLKSLFGHSEQISNRSIAFDGFWNFGDSFGNDLLKEVCFTLSCPSHKGHSKLQCCINTYEREYTQGVLKMERIINQPLLKPERNKGFNKIQKRPVEDHGQTIYKGHKSYYLMLNLQLGVRYTVGKITPVPVREVCWSDFGPFARIMMHFPRNGSQFTPPHHSIDFNWKDYCPMVFRNLREMFKIDAADYMVSVCGNDGLKKLSSPGKSGSIFYLSQDERFVIKTLRKVELKGLLKMLPKYYDHVGAHDNTLITKFFGLHRITIKYSQKVRFVVMGNMFCTELHIHRRYDLKGSSHGRSTSPEKINHITTLKDLDLPYIFCLEKSWRDSLFRQISLDCKFLKSQSIIDYSLLLGVHFRAPVCLRSPLQVENLNDCPNLATDHNSDLQKRNRLYLQKGLCLVTHEPGSVSSMQGSHIRGSTLRVSAHGDEEREVDLLLPGAGRLRVQLGVNMPAKANKKFLHTDDSDSSETDLLDSYDVVLYLGIIDILQEYNISKKVEHTLKSLNHDANTISAIKPKLYSQRFISFLETVFP